MAVDWCSCHLGVHRAKSVFASVVVCDRHKFSSALIYKLCMRSENCGSGRRFKRNLHFNDDVTHSERYEKFKLMRESPKGREYFEV